MINNGISSDAILESMNNMSQKEIEDKFGINLDVDTTVTQNINSQPINYDDFEDDEEEQIEFENGDLADAFADEIAGIDEDDDNN